MTTVRTLADACGLTVKDLQALADRLPEGLDYRIQRRPRKQGPDRVIVIPRSSLDTVTKKLYGYFDRELSFQAPDHVFGFVRGRSTRHNAARHLAKPCVLRVDLNDFFPSISADMVSQGLLTQGFDVSAAALATRVVTLNEKLPIGLATSPYLSNLIFKETDDALVAWAEGQSLTFTRYVDDLTFSGELDDALHDQIVELLNRHGWRVNARKTAFMRRGGAQYVTGLYVGLPDRPRIPRYLKREMRWIIHMLERNGYRGFMALIDGGESRLGSRRILGWARYIASVEPELGYPLLTKLSGLLPDHDEDADLEDYFDPDAL